MSHTGEVKAADVRGTALSDLWVKRSHALKRSATISITLLTVFSLIIMLGAAYLFKASLSTLLQGSAGFVALQGAVMTAIGAGASALLLNAFSRMTFSALHLQRDAEERALFAKMYEEIVNDGLDPEVSAIAIQALFSRIDPGLFKAGHAPSMNTIPETTMAAVKSQK